MGEVTINALHRVVHRIICTCYASSQSSCLFPDGATGGCAADNHGIMGECHDLLFTHQLGVSVLVCPNACKHYYSTIPRRLASLRVLQQLKLSTGANAPHDVAAMRHCARLS